jgi:hypothetical protein
MCEACACPGEKITETTERKEPIEDGELERSMCARQPNARTMKRE